MHRPDRSGQPRRRKLRTSTGHAAAPHLEGSRAGAGVGYTVRGDSCSRSRSSRWRHRASGIITSVRFRCLLGPGVPGPFHDFLRRGFGAVRASARRLLLEYFPFIILLLSLFTVAGGVRLTGSLQGNAGGQLRNSLGGNGDRQLDGHDRSRHVADPAHHSCQSVAQVPGAHHRLLHISWWPTSADRSRRLGDPPLFLGFLKGVDFFWPTTHMLSRRCSWCPSSCWFVFYGLGPRDVLRSRGPFRARGGKRPFGRRSAWGSRAASTSFFWGVWSGPCC